MISKLSGPKKIEPAHTGADLHSEVADIAEAIFKGLSPLTDNLRSRYLMYRLEQSVCMSLDAIPQPASPVNPLFFLASFNFNEYSVFYKKLGVEFGVDWNSGHKISVQIPLIKPVLHLAPAIRIKSALLKIAAVNVNIENAVITNAHLAEFAIPYEDITIPTQKLVLPIAGVRNSITVIATALDYISLHNKKSAVIENKRWQPVNMLDAAYFFIP